jgi:predicted transcriptional regulator
MPRRVSGIGVRGGVWVGHVDGHPVELWPYVTLELSRPEFTAQVVVDGRDRYEITSCNQTIYDTANSVVCKLLTKLVPVRDVYYAVWAVKSVATLVGTCIVAAIERMYLQLKDMVLGELSKAGKCINDLSCINKSSVNMVKAIALATSSYIRSTWPLQLPESERDIALQIAESVASSSVPRAASLKISTARKPRQISDKEKRSLLYAGDIGSLYVHIAPDYNLNPYLAVGTSDATVYMIQLTNDSLNDAIAAIALIAANEYRVSSGVMYEVATNRFIQDAVVKYVSSNLGAIVGALDDAFMPLYKYMALS